MIQSEATICVQKSGAALATLYRLNRKSSDLTTQESMDYAFAFVDAIQYAVPLAANVAAGFVAWLLQEPIADSKLN